MRKITSLTQDWWFGKGHHVPSLLDTLEHCQLINIPHNAVDIPLNYFDETTLHSDFSYHKFLEFDTEQLRKQQVLRFEGVMADAKVYVNGNLCTTHSDGYTPFDVHLNRHLQVGRNLITVTLSGKENPAIPPFGGRIDFICFPGIYREVNLTEFGSVRIKNIKVETEDVLTYPKLTIHVSLEDLQRNNEKIKHKIRLFDSEQNLLVDTQEVSIYGERIDFSVAITELNNIKLWDIDHPELYTVEVTICGESVSDTMSCRFGFRQAEFTEKGFFLNGTSLKICGVNRHQSYPYKGYAMGKRAQQFDAEYIKNELGLNLVRTSHYPQCPHFLDRCDELGLLVFEEIAGWQHIGDERWQQKAIDNVQAMIERDWNHPSIILWGTRINESIDNHDFYTQTNQRAKQIDATRQTGGVRCIQNSELIEDVYTMNDFILSDDEINPRGEISLRTPNSVTGLKKAVPYLVTEYGGHMFPTKRQDCENWQQEHVMRHLKVLDASFGNSSISGAISWCLFDYNTHRDFGSGDKVCYHGISDAFRMPKFAAFVYASQQSPLKNPILKPVTYWARGERPAAKILPLIILTNCDSVKITLADGQSQLFFPDSSRFPHLPYPPIVIDEYSVGQLEIGGWGMLWDDVTFTGIVEGEEIIISEYSGSPIPTTLKISTHSDELLSQCGDSTRIAISVLDQKQQIMPYFKDVLTLSATENLSIIGPSQLSVEGGVAALWVEAIGAGEAIVTVDSSHFGQQQVKLFIR